MTSASPAASATDGHAEPCLLRLAAGRGVLTQAHPDVDARLSDRLRAWAWPWDP